MNGILSCFIGEMLAIANIIIYSQRIKYAKSVYRNDILEFKAEAVKVYDIVGVESLNIRLLNSKINWLRWNLNRLLSWI